jgi:hypothetical protein
MTWHTYTLTYACIHTYIQEVRLLKANLHTYTLTYACIHTYIQEVRLLKAQLQKAQLDKNAMKKLLEAKEV